MTHPIVRRAAVLGSPIAHSLSPVLHRIGFHLHRLTGGIERGFFLRLTLGLFAVVAIASVLVTAIEGRRDSVGAAAESFGATLGRRCVSAKPTSRKKGCG